MPYLPFLLSLALLFCILYNALAFSTFRKTAATAIRTYGPDPRRRNTAKIIFCVLGALALGGAVYYLIAKPADEYLQLAVSCGNLMLFCVLYAFVPFSNAYWCITAEGIYSYNLRRLIPWSQIIRTGSLKRRKQTFLTMEVKKVAGEMFKKVFYGFPIPEDQTEEARSIIRDFMNALEKQKMMKRDQDEKKIPLKERKWY